MDRPTLLLIKHQLDLTLQSPGPETEGALQDLMRTALDGRAASRDEQTAGQVLTAVEETWAKGKTCIEPAPDNPSLQARLESLLADIHAVADFALAVSLGDLSQTLSVRGRMAGSLKSLQASLRHLTWQTRQIAAGDFNQRVDFMGEFSDAFNAMVQHLDEARAQLRSQTEELTRVNASLAVEIGERQANEARLRQSEERFRRLVDSMDDWVFTLDLNQRFTGLYGNFSRLGLLPTAVLGQTAQDVFGAGRSEPHQTAFARALCGESVVYDWSWENESQTRFIQVRLNPLRGPNGEIEGIVGLSRDVTELARTEAERREAEAQAQVQHSLMDQREQERLQIARDLHDGPIQDLIAVTYALAGIAAQSQDASQSEALQSIQESIKALIGELRSFAGELRPPALSKFGLSAALKSHVERFREQHPGYHFHLDLPAHGPDLPETVSLALFRVCQEALNNIFRHAGADQVDIQIQLQDGAVCLTIEDNGCGFDLPESWVELARNGHLGLAGMRERVEAIGGRLDILSSAGSGTTVRATVALPQSTPQVHE